MNNGLHQKIERLIEQETKKDEAMMSEAYEMLRNNWQDCVDYDGRSCRGAAHKLVIKLERRLGLTD